MTTDANNQPPEESPKPSLPILHTFYQTQRRPLRPTQKGQPLILEPRDTRLEALIDPAAITIKRYIALDVSAEVFSEPAMDPDSAIESLYKRLGYDGTDSYTGTIILIEAVGSPLFVLSLNRLNFGAGYMRLQSYRPDLAAKRRDAAAADVDESERKH